MCTRCVPPHVIVWSNHIAVFCNMTHCMGVLVAKTVLKMETDIFPTTAGKHCSCTSQHYRIAGKFQGRKLLQISWFCVFAKVFFANLGVWCLLARQKRAIHESFLREIGFFTDLRKFSFSKVFHYTVCTRCFISSIWLHHLGDCIPVGHS